MLLIAIAIVVESGRPVLFSQLRLGRNGAEFRMYKFRKFRPDCSASGMPLTRCKDDRSTKVGRLLAGTKLDELPQLYNILRGDMAFVGPRPESFAFAGCFDGRYKAVLDYKPGIFGPSQAAFRNEAKLYPVNEDLVGFYREVLFPLKASLDLEYYARRTLLADLVWIARGVQSVIGLRLTLTQLPAQANPPTGRSDVAVPARHWEMRPVYRAGRLMQGTVEFRARRRRH
jgi:lipopolysaccharide/colanic/teichoic acid biosynthesis glycosyltransferase